MNRRRDWSTVVVLLTCMFGALVFLAVLTAGEDFMCAHSNGQKPSYCEAGK